MSKYTALARQSDEHHIRDYEAEMQIASTELKAARKALDTAHMTGDDDYDLCWAAERYRKAMYRIADLKAGYALALKRLGLEES